MEGIIKGYEILSRYKNKKCFYGVAIYNDKKIFYKEFDSHDDKEKELKGYFLICNYYNVPKIINTYENIIMYEYKEELLNETIYEYLYLDNLNINMDSILKQYENSLSNVQMLDEKELSNYKFFAKRKEMIENYITKIPNEKNNLNRILEIIVEPKILSAFISQGDPTDTNIGVNGLFTDFENGGYNSVVGEISIFLVSILTHGSYFYPKYNSNVYEIRPKYKVCTRISDKNKKILISYLNMIKNKLNCDEINKYLKYYICFRFLTPIDILKMNVKDRNIIFKLINMFLKTKNIDDILKLIEEWDVCFIEKLLN